MIKVPVSFGEAIDKITILEIKLERIPDSSKYISLELSALQASFSPYYTPVVVFYKAMLKNVNALIWEMQDEFRSANLQSEQISLCYRIIELNDARFRIKQKVDCTLNSSLREQKSYPKKKAFVLGHLGMGDHITCSPIVRYLSSMYDEVVVVAKEGNAGNVQQLYADDFSIKVFSVTDDADISPNYGFRRDLFEQVILGYDFIPLGYHKIPHKPLKGLLPFCFYDDIGLDHDYLLKYFFVPESDRPNPITDLPPGLEVCLMHSQVSTGQLFSYSNLVSRFIDLDSALLVDINCNPYDPSHPYYELAGRFVGLPLFDYIPLLRKAHYIAVTDSSLFTLAICLPLVASRFFCFSRSSGYEYLNPIRKMYLEPIDGYVAIESLSSLE